MNEEERQRELEELRGLVHTGRSSPWTGMKMASLKRKYPRHYLKFEEEQKEANWREDPTEREPR